MTCKKICTGEMRTYVEVETPTRSSDGAGGFTTTWAASASIWCKVEEQSGGESFTHQAQEYQTKVKFYTHYRDDIYVTDRLKLNGVYHNIRRIDNLDRLNRYMLIVADGGVVD